MTKRGLLLSAAALAIGMIPAVVSAQSQIVLTPASVIGSSGNYDGRPAGNIFDQQVGDVSDIGLNGYQYWINSEGGPANAYITIDLGAAYTLSSFKLFNTHNGPYGDRGTGDFSIVGGNSVDSGNGFQLTGATTALASGTLAAAPISDPIAGSSFTSLSNGTFRYLEFLPTSVASVNPPCCSANEYGLAELRVYSGPAVTAVPEPASWAMLIVGFGMIGAGLRYRRRQTTIRYLAA